MIEIPGYRILRQLGRGGMATVYLAMQESVDREVALKVMSPALLVDPNFGERFLREAKIAARLHHRHVVGIHDVGRLGDCHYIAMEYLAGGPVLSKDGHPRSVPFALRVIREIATAIGYAQQKGFVHRDVKPDNILLRDDGSSALTDFGIARANDSATRMTRTGAVVGTPHYMSPEQARGKQIDGRSDLYALGIVLYELLVGRVPYHAEDSLAVGIMHITQPVPRLPDSLAPLQPLIDRLLAKDPQDRFQTGNDAAAAIAEIERRVAVGDLTALGVGAPEYRAIVAQYTSGEISNPGISNPGISNPGVTVVSPLPDAVRRRAEPSLGRLDGVIAAADRASARQSVPAPRADARKTWIVVPLVLAALVVAGALVWFGQDRLRALLPNTELNELLARGQRALDADRLDGADGARALFQTARTLEPDNDVARAGLAKVGERLLEQARRQLSAGNLDAAGGALASARELLGGGSAVDALDQQLRAASARGTELADALAGARSALDAGRITDPDGAVAQYRRVLAADPDNALAKVGLTRAADTLAAQARSALDAGDAATATARIEDIERVVPDYPGVPELRGQLSRQRETAASAIARDLDAADARLRAGNAANGGDSALALYQSVLARDAGNARAQAGLRRVGQALLVQANAAIEDGNATQAERLLAQAASIAPGLGELRSARESLADLRDRQSADARRLAITPADRERLRKLVEEAEQATAAGKLILPPGASAYDKYRAALAIDGSDAQALAGLTVLAGRARGLFESHLRESELLRARDDLDALRQIAPTTGDLDAMTARLIQALLDQAQARLDAGQREDAQRSLSAVRELAPANPRLIELGVRLRATPTGS